MIKAIEARRQSQANELTIKQKHIQLANELIDEVIEPAIMEAIEHGLFKTEVTNLHCDPDTFLTVIRKLEQYEYYIASRNLIAKSLVIDWEERIMVGTPTPRAPSQYPDTLMPVWKEPNFDIT